MRTHADCRSTKRKRKGDCGNECHFVNINSWLLTLNDYGLGEEAVLSIHLKELSRLSSLSVSGTMRATPSLPDPKGIRLPKLDVLVFNGHILNWRWFWEQCIVSMHECPSLSDAALRGGTAKGAIERLSRSIYLDTPQSRRKLASVCLVVFYAANTKSTSGKNSVICKSEKHPLNDCPKFRDILHDERITTLRTNSFCMNCQSPNHSN